MADKTIRINIKSDADLTIKSVEDLKLELRALETQFETVQVGSSEFTRLGNEIKKTRSQLKDIDLQFEGLDKEQRATALVDTFQGLVGAVGAVSSAFIAFGANSEAIEGAEKKLLGIIGVVSGLRDASNGLVAAGKLFGPTFAAVGDSIKAGFTAGATGAQTFKAALISTGIGAFIVAVGLLAQVLIESANAAGIAEEGLEKYSATLEGINRQFSVARSNINELTAVELKDAELRGASIEELSKIRKDSLNEQLDNIDKESKALLTAFLENGKRIRETVKDEKEAAKQRTQAQADFTKAGQRLGDEQSKLRNQLDIEDKELAIKQRERAKKLAEDRKKFTLDSQKDLVAALQALRLTEAKTEEEQARVTLLNTLANLETARKAKIAEANKLGLDVFNINQTYDALNEDARIKFNNEIAKIDKAAQEKIASDAATARDKELSKIDTYYNDLLAGIDLVADDIAISQGIRSKEQFDAIEEFIKTALNQSIELVKQENTVLAKGAEGEKEILLKRNSARIKALEDLQLARQAEFEKEKATAGLNNEQLKEIEDRRQADFDAFQKKKLAVVDATAREIVKIDEDTAQKQKDNQQQLTEFVLNSASSLLGDLKELNSIFDSDNEAAAKQAFERNKSISIAETIISTYLAAQKAYTSQLTLTPDSPIRASIAAGIAIASGLARVAVIKSQKFDGGGSTGGGGAAGGSAGSASGGGNILNPFGTEGGGTNILPPRLAPPSGGGTQADTTGRFDQGIGQTPIIRTYVLAGDVTDAQVANEKINQKRKF
jgi:hypothetical protein